MYISLFLASLLAIYGGVKAEDSCNLREIDLCTAILFVSATEGVPGTDEEIDRVCEPVDESFECFANYSKYCFTEMMQEMYDMVIAEPREMQRKFCSVGSEERKRYLKNAPCFQKVLSADNIRPHIEDMIAALETATQAQFDNRIPILCCGVQRMFSVVVDMIKAECGDSVLEEGGALLGLPISSLQNMFCRGFERGSEKCNGILPPAGTPSKGMLSENQLIRFVSSAMANFM